MDTRKIRKENLLSLAKKYGGPTALAAKIGQSKAWISQLIGRNAKRPIGDTAASNIEAKLGLSPGWLDSTHKQSAINQDLLIEALEMVSSTCKAVGVTPSTAKFARLVVAVYGRLENGPLELSEVRELVALAA